MKRNSIIFIVLFVFFIVVAIGALYMLNPSESVFNKNAKTIGAQTAVMSKTVVGDEPTEELVVPDTIEEIPVAETVAEEVVEETSIENIDESALNNGQGDGTGAGDASGAGSGEGAGESAEAAPTEKYFTFKTSTSRTVLNFRKEPASDSKILWKLAPGTFGYVLLIGDEWSRVALENGAIGYCATEYLEMTEVTRADFPEEYAALVGVPDENLSADTE